MQEMIVDGKEHPYAMIERTLDPTRFHNGHSFLSGFKSPSPFVSKTSFSIFSVPVSKSIS